MKSNIAVVRERGQVTIPKSLRDTLGISPGTELEFDERDGSLVGKRVVRKSPVAGLIGQAEGRDSDALLAELRGPAWTPEIDR